MKFTERFSEYSLPKLTRGVRLPEFRISKEHIKKYDLPQDCTDRQFLLALSLIGLEAKVGRNHPDFKEYQKRMEMELGVFRDLGFSSYVLLTWEIVDFCRSSGIATGFGRGSVGGSLVFYLLDVVRVDPLRHGLYFERFLSKARAKFSEIEGVRYYQGDLLMDVDLDISFAERERVVEWLKNKYPARMAKLSNLVTFSSRILLRELCRAMLGYSEEEANHVTASIPEIFGRTKDLDDSIDESPEFKKFAKEHPDVIAVARKLHGLARHAGVHASAFAISFEPIREVFPLQLSSDKDVVTGYDMDDVLNMAAKVDILGLRCATLLEKACAAVGIKPEEINTDDPGIYENLADLRTPHGVFQLEAPTNHKVLQAVKPRNLEHLSAVLALARPGALEFTDRFAKFVKTGEFQSIHPFFDDVLKPTGGLCLYQESTLQLLNLVGFSLDASETARRVIGKKKRDQVKEWKQKIFDKIKEKNLDEKAGEILWGILQNSADYSFNKSHATAYASMSAATAYLKFNHPHEFFLSLLQLTREESNPIEQIRIINGELKFFNIVLMPPHIVKSSMDFKAEDGNIRFGLGSIKGIAEANMKRLLNFRTGDANKADLFLGALEARIPLDVMTALILSGAMDTSPEPNRPWMLLEFQLFKLLTDGERRKVLDIGPEYGFNLLRTVTEMTRKNDAKGKPFIKASRFDTIKKHFTPHKAVYEENAKHVDFGKWWFERQLLGFAYSTSLHKIFTNAGVTGLVDIGTVPHIEEGERLATCGEVVKGSLHKGKSRAKGTPYLKFDLNDNLGTSRVMLFETKGGANISLCEEMNGRLPREGDAVVVEGSKKGDCIFAQRVSVENLKVFSRFAQLSEKIVDNPIIE